MNESWLISLVGSSKSEVDCASCVSLPSFSAVVCISAPICEAAAANCERVGGPPFVGAPAGGDGGSGAR